MFQSDDVETVVITSPGRLSSRGEMRAIRFALLTILFVAAIPEASYAGPATCSKDQKRAVQEYLVGRRVTAKVGLPLRNFPGLRVYWNGEYDLEYYAWSLKYGPVSVPSGRASVIKKVGFKKKDMYVDVNGRGGSGAAFKRAGSDPEWAFRKGSRVNITFGRVLTERDCRIESVVLALSGVMDVAGAEEYRVKGARAAGMMPVESEADLGITQPGLMGDPNITADLGVVPTANPTLTILAAEVEPVQVQPGDQLKLTVHFQLNGIPPGVVVPVTEERQLYFQGQPLFSSPRAATQSWQTGTHTTDLTMRFPGSAATGVYRFVITLEALGQKLEQEAVFVVNGQ